MTLNLKSPALLASGPNSWPTPLDRSRIAKVVGDIESLADAVNQIQGGSNPFPEHITDTTNSTSVSTGALIVDGGIGIAKAIFGGTTLNIAGISTLTGGINTGSGAQIGSDSPTINKPSGTITTAVTATTPQNSKTVTLTNSLIVATSKVFVSISGYGGTGLPVIYQVTPGTGSVVILILNTADTGGANLSAAMDLNFVVFN